MVDLMNYYSPDDTPERDFSPIPAGEYLAKIVASEMKETSAKTGEYLALTLEICDGPATGRKLWDNLNLKNPNSQTQEIARSRLASIRAAVGIKEPRDSQEIHGVPVIVRVGIEERKDKPGELRNVIKAYKNRASSTPATSVPPCSLGDIIQ